ncbi:hypothetical protein FSP39_015238 [Pinctada imbricata]|uniref:Uncharacterized protein n=1 Tax=Pinctada imbricata TaxID=66713 RepID=A0AA88YII9_PINIB|nr:hypothetical protein FSP39_015238 [Pinctada imbricata]
MAFVVNPDFIEEQAFAHLNSSHTGDIGKLNKQEMARVREAISKTTKHYLDVIHKLEAGKTPEACLSHLEPGHIDLIKKSMEIQTYEMTLTHNNEVEFTFQGETLSYPPTLPYNNAEDADQAGTFQMVSIIIESITLILNMIGISVPGSVLRNTKVIRKVTEVLSKNPVLKSMVGYMVSASKDGRLKDIVVQMFKVVKVLWKGGVLMGIAKAIFASMSWFDWILTAAKLTAQIIAMVFTGGAAQIATLIVRIVSAVLFLKKAIQPDPVC